MSNQARADHNRLLKHCREMEKRFVVRAGEQLYLNDKGKETRVFARAARFATTREALRFINQQLVNADLCIDTIDNCK